MHHSTSLAPMKNLIFGVLGQDGYFLSQALEKRGHEIVGVLNSRKVNTSIPHWRGESFKPKNVDFFNVQSLTELINNEKPDVIYNLVGFSSVRKSFLFPQECFSINLVFYELLLTALKQSRFANSARLVHCSSSEMYAGIENTLVDENTTPIPISPYGISKTAAHFLSQTYREAFGILVSNAILFNHESELRKDDFFFHRATSGVVDYYLGRTREIEIESIDFKRDWSFAGDVVEGLILMSSPREASDFVIASGKLYSGRDFFRVAFSHLGIDEDIDEVVVRRGVQRPVDHKGIAGNPAKIENELGWLPKLTFEKLVERVLVKEISKRTSI